ncbi:MAG: hypothetical protein HKN17_09260 [Rhodothermales bacterium]|nr:hypothetical protein [Rhodothermales bacterium]
MKKSISHLLAVRFAAVALLSAGLLLTGCDSPTSALSDTESAFEDGNTSLEGGGGSIDDLTQTLVQELDMTADQQASIDADMQRHAVHDLRAGKLWYLSVRLQHFLTDRQKEKLFRIAAHHADRQLHKLVGVYAPCVVPRPDESDHPRLIRIHLIADLLSDEQRSQIEEIRARFSAETLAIRERVQQGDLSQEEGAEQMRQLAEATQAEILAVLSPEQIAALEERLSAVGPDYETHLALNRRAMIDALNLRDAQVERLDVLHRMQCEDFRSLLGRLHAEEITREEFREGRKRLVHVKLSAYGDVLGESQFEAAKIHDALLVVNARRFINHLTDGTDAVTDAGRTSDGASGSASGSDTSTASGTGG